MIYLHVMNLWTLKLALSIGSLFVSVGLILTDVCLFGRRECFLSPRRLSNNLVVSLERLSFLQTISSDHEENVLDLPKGLNHHVWEYNCVKTIETLCNFPVFPKAPDRRHIIFRTEIIAARNHGVDGHRLVGYVIPNSTGEYYFAVASNGFSEVWLSPIKSWRAAKQVAYIRPHDALSTIKRWDFGSLKSQISTGIHLNARKRYFIEIIYSLGARKNGENFLQVAWKRPGKAMFEIIEGESLSLYTNDSEKAKYKMFDDELPDAHYCAKYRKGYVNKYMKPEIYPSLENTAVNKTLALCDYSPSYLVDPDNLLGFEQYYGVYKHIRKTYSYPYPNIDGIVRSQAAHQVFQAENPLDEQEAWTVVETYMEAVENSYPE